MMANEGEAAGEIYAAPVLAHLQAIWGEGFLSPGGPAEVAALVQGLDLTGRAVLDLGCGVGGPSLELIQAHSAGRVLGVDIEGGVVEQARQAAQAAGPADRVTFLQVEPGPLPLEAESFDVVFSKDALVKMTDKRPVYAEVWRVLRPGGTFVASDWLRANGPLSAQLRRWLLFAAGIPRLPSVEEAAELLRATGFEKVEIHSRNEWYRAEARRDLARMEGPLWPKLVAARSEAAAREALEFWRLMIEVLDSGDFCPANLRAWKPG
jgi:ubiquinone/menaquinone biosynthesis C-methylase UbiE